MIADKCRFRSYLYKFFLLIAAVCFIILFLLFNLIIIQEKTLEGKIYPGVYINNVAFGKKTPQEVIDFFNAKNDQLKNVNISIFYQDKPIATLSAQALQLAYDSAGIAERAYLVGRSTNPSSQLYQKLAAIFGLDRFDLDIQINWDKDLIDKYVVDLEENYNRPAKNALFTFENGRVVSFRQEEKGVKIESEKFAGDIEKAILELQKKIENKKVTVISSSLDPEISLSKANNFGIEEFLAEGVSNFSHSIAERIHNIALASSKFNGILIPKDKVFSFNDTVGDISSSTGYKPAYIIKDGKTVLGDGGGVCQVSTTFFRAALNAGLPIIERHPHAYRVSYYENDSKPGFDATVFAPTTDLKVKNNTPAYILIQTEIDYNNNLLYFRFYGKKDNRIVEISPVSVYDVQAPPPPLYQDDPTLKKGVVKQIDFPAWGAKTNFHYKVTLDGKTVIDQNFFSNYRPWQAVYLRGVAD